MGMIEARIGRTDLGDEYRSIAFSPPLPPELIQKIHGDEHEKEFGLPYIRLKTLAAPDKTPFTECTIYGGPINPSRVARNVAAEIIKTAIRETDEITDGEINRFDYRSTRNLYPFGLCSQVVLPPATDITTVITPEPISIPSQLAA